MYFFTDKTADRARKNVDTIRIGSWPRNFNQGNAVDAKKLRGIKKIAKEVYRTRKRCKKAKDRFESAVDSDAKRRKGKFRSKERT